MIDSTHIEMSRKATEIQDLWEPKEGDKITSWQEFASKRVPAPMEILRRGKYGSLMDFEGNYLRNPSNAVWLPRQEDLQEIARKNLSKTTWGLTVLFYEFFKEKCAVNKITNRLNANEPLNTVWLCFVMETCYGKHWDDKKKTWTVI
ncbi:MAG: hypothetical protein A4E26_01745 [Methanobacterium sp. PtaU1.Bin097]|nr:MAG: hypothetical protein A4E26_01745 [Methanobacterium sp. PtaU1.Bin097]